jgi:hypothetical protein
MLECPNCKELSISALRKQFIGPLRKISCPTCKAEISVGWLQSIILGIIVWVLPIVWLVVLVSSGVLQAAVVAILTMIVVGAYQHFLVPLKVRTLPENG